MNVFSEMTELRGRVYAIPRHPNMDLSNTRQRPTDWLLWRARRLGPLAQTLDLPAGIAARDAAIQQVLENASKPKVAALQLGLLRCLHTMQQFNTDLIWVIYDQLFPDRPHEPRVLGPVVKAAQRSGLMTHVGSSSLSERPEAHGGPKALWWSLILGPDGPPRR